MKELVYNQFFLDSAESFGEKVGFIDGDYTATYAQHLERVLKMGQAIKALGVQKQDRFAVMAMNSHHFMELYHAAFLGAGVINPLNLRLAPKELEYILKDSGTKVVFADAWFAGVIDEVRGGTDIEAVVLIGDGDVPHDHKIEELLAAAKPELLPEPQEDDPVVLMYTGGTTGLPKGVLIDQRAEMLNLLHILAVFPFEQNTIYLHQTPMFHAASMGGILGAALGITSIFTPVFNAGEVLKAIEQHGVTQTMMVPTMISMVFDHPEFDPKRVSSLENLVYGASPMPELLLQKIIDQLPNAKLYQGYGMTEGSAVLTVLMPDDHARGGDVLKSAGRAIPGTRLSIQDEDGKLLPRGETGEVCASGGNFMIEYWKKPEATAEVFKDGWYHTGDAGYIDREGYLFLVDRVKDMIVTGGENVYSAEVENAVARHPAVGQVAVIGIPSEEWGEAVHAVVVLLPGAEATDKEIIDSTREWIAGYKVPKSVEFRTEALPLSGAMKVLKRELRAPHWEGHSRNVG